MMDIFSLLRERDMLLIDDDEWIRDSLSIYFDSEDCRIVTCESAEEGFQALDRQQFDIIIADYRLPGMDGIEFFEKSRLSHSDVVKILITAYSTDSVICRAKAGRGKDDYSQTFHYKGFIGMPGPPHGTGCFSLTEETVINNDITISAKGACHAGKKLDE